MNRSYVTKEDENLYYNLFISNNTNHDLPLETDQILSTPLLSDPSQYEMSIVKFTLPGGNIPLFNNSITSASTSYSDPKRFITVVKWDGAGVKTSAENALSWKPTAYFASSGVYSFAVFNYQTIIDTMNSAMKASFTTLGVADADIPYFTYTPDSDLINFVIPTATCRNNLQGTVLPPTTGVSTYQIFLSSEMGQWIQGFNLYYTASAPYGFTDDYKYTQLMVFRSDEVSTASPPWGTGPTFPFTIKSGFSTTSYFNKCKSIIITSRNIPISQENYPILNATDKTPLSYLVNNSNSSTLNIVSDFTISPQNGADTRQYLEYLPTAEYRILDLVASSPLARLDFQVWYLNSDSTQTTGFNLNQFLLNPGQSFAMKILFRRKRF